ncbi:MAG: septal ring lytic transglycosylase RlpA family protein [Bacteroidaceae bacterium]|nr:septal ring lytic transglycosylase RlpA family protein [Bacteroidaceae bacterium]
MAALGCVAVKAQDSVSVKPYQTGLATYYSAKMHGRRMSSGKVYSKEGYTCAHRTLPFGTKVRVVNKKNGKSIVVEVHDRGPFAKGRVIDLSNSAAKALDMLGAGVVPVELYLVADSVKQ